MADPSNPGSSKLKGILFTLGGLLSSAPLLVTMEIDLHDLAVNFFVNVPGGIHHVLLC